MCINVGKYKIIWILEALSNNLVIWPTPSLLFYYFLLLPSSHYSPPSLLPYSVCIFLFSLVSGYCKLTFEGLENWLRIQTERSQYGIRQMLFACLPLGQGSAALQDHSESHKEFGHAGWGCALSSLLTLIITLMRLPCHTKNINHGLYLLCYLYKLLKN